MAQRPTSLGPKPSLFFVFFVFFVSFPFFAFNTKNNLVFPPEKGIFCLFSVFLFLSPLAFFGLPLFLFLFLFLCLSLSSFLSFFLLVFLFCFLLVPCFCLFLSFSIFFAFVSWKEQHQHIQLQVFSSSIVFSFWGVSCLFYVWSSFFLSLLFPDLKLWFLFNIMVLGFETNNKKTEFCGQKGGCNKTDFFMNLCFAKRQKLSFFLAIFLAIFGWCSQNTIRIGISAHF